MNWDNIIRDNRVTIAYVFPAIGSAALLASPHNLLPAVLSFNPWLLLFGVAVMRSPLIVGLLPVLDRWSAAGITGLAAYAYFIEYIGLVTGWPYGSFTYTVSLGPMVHGVPVALPLLFLPLVFNAYLLGLLVAPYASRWQRVSLVVAAVVAMDVVLDPGAVSLGFWSYASGAVYGVPWTNGFGSILSGVITVTVLGRTVDRDKLQRRLVATPFMLDDMISFVLLWGVINAWYGNLLSLGVACLFAYALWAVDAFDMPSFTEQRWIFT